MPRSKRPENVDTIEKLAALMVDGFAEMDERFNAVDASLRDIRAQLADLNTRVDRLEELGASQAGFAKEIDHILSRLKILEERVGISHP